MSEPGEASKQIEQLYSQYKTAEFTNAQSNQKKQSLLSRFIKKSPPIETNRARPKEFLDRVEDLIRSTPGKYPLTEIAYRPEPPTWHSGFAYGFEYPLGDEKLYINYFSYNHWGIKVKKTTGSSPELEILEETITPTKEELEEDPDLNNYKDIDIVIHLPEGFKIPVGPLHFESDSLPKTEAELASEKAAAIQIVKKAGIKVDPKIPEAAEKLSGVSRKYPDRYFYWEPEIPDEPTKIAIDFEKIAPYNMGLNLEDAPTFNNTVRAEKL